MMPNIDKSHIQQRVEDWKKRIEDLYAFVENELSQLPGVSIKKDRYVQMYEELMVKFDVEAQSIIILDVYKNGNLALSFKPVGLWVIGANGRIDILTSKGSYILVDRAEHGDNSQWVIYSPKNRRSGETLTSEIILKLMEDI